MRTRLLLVVMVVPLLVAGLLSTPFVASAQAAQSVQTAPQQQAMPLRATAYARILHNDRYYFTMYVVGSGFSRYPGQRVLITMPIWHYGHVDTVPAPRFWTDTHGSFRVTVVVYCNKHQSYHVAGPRSIYAYATAGDFRR